MDKRALKDSVFGDVSQITKSISNPHRLEILDIISHGEHSVEEISKETGMTVANASQHLQRLKHSKLVKDRREKNFVYYRLANPYVYAIWKAIREFSRYQLPEINSLLAQVNKEKNLKSIFYADLGSLQPFTLLDVRKRKEFETQHHPDAINIPSEEITRSINQIDKSNPVVVCCRGPFCTKANEAIEELQQHGYDAYKLEEGVLDI